MRKNLFIKKEYKEENVILYLHFQGENAVRQIEIYPEEKIKLSELLPIFKGHFLYDQNFSDVKWDECDFITKNEFEKEWNKNNG